MSNDENVYIEILKQWDEFYPTTLDTPELKIEEYDMYHSISALPENIFNRMSREQFEEFISKCVRISRLVMLSNSLSHFRVNDDEDGAIFASRIIPLNFSKSYANIPLMYEKASS